MAVPRSLGMLLASALACACAPEPVMKNVVTQQAAKVVHQDIDFARGCWSQRDAWGLVVQTLNLLPPDEPTSQTISGQLERHSRSTGVIRSTPYSIRRDGSALTLSGNPERMAIGAGDTSRRPKPDGAVTYRIAQPPLDAPRIISATSRRAVFQGPWAGWQVFEGQGDRLVLYILRDNGHAISVFDGRRELCEWSEAANR